MLGELKPKGPNGGVSGERLHRREEQHLLDVGVAGEEHHEPVDAQVQGSRFRVQSSEFRAQGSGFRVQGTGFRVQGTGFRVQGSGFRADLSMPSPKPAVGGRAWSSATQKSSSTCRVCVCVSERVRECVRVCEREREREVV